MDYRDKIFNSQINNSAFDTMRSATERFEKITKLSQPLVQMPRTPEFINGIDQTIDAFNGTTALKSSIGQMQKTTELTRRLAELSVYQNNINNIINGISPLLVNMQSTLSNSLCSVNTMLDELCSERLNGYFTSLSETLSDFSTSFSKTLNGITTSISDALRISETSLSKMLNGIATSLSSIDNMNFRNLFEKTVSFGEDLGTLAQSMTIRAEWLDQIDFGNIANSFEQTKVLEKTLLKYEQATGVESAASNEEIIEFHKDLQDLDIENKNWQQMLAEKVGKWKDKNPVIYAVIVQILLPLLISIFASFLYAKITTPKAAIKEEPSATGEVIYNITINQDVTIINDTRYYYKVLYHNKENDEIIAGWVSKRSLEINDDISSLE